MGEQISTKEAQKENPVAFELIGDNEIEILRALSKDSAGKPGLIDFLGMVREFGHSGSSIDQIGHGYFVLDTTDTGDKMSITGLDFVPREEAEKLGKELATTQRGHYKFWGAENFIRNLALRIFERIEKAGSEMAKNNYLKYKEETTKALEKYYPDKREGAIEFDCDGYGGVSNLKYTAKRINFKGDIIN